MSTIPTIHGLLGDRSRPLDPFGQEEPSGPPPVGMALAELAGAAQVYRLAMAQRRLRRAPRAPVGAPPVIDVPGWVAPESLTGPLRRYLRSLGHDARGWGFGQNRGDIRGDVVRLERQVVSRSDVEGPVALVGWSLGGVVVREVARLRPDRVSQVITYGTPLVGGTAHTAGAWLSRHRDAQQVAAYVDRREREHPLEVPVTVIVSRRDGVVSWRSCLDHHSPLAEHVEVGSTHIAMVLDPDVWLTIAKRLGEPAVADHLSS
jgi:pimeloyl-ACP methyl ester carboxylesterase